MASYWDKVLHSRLSRRRALAASGGAALGAAILSACGGGDEDGGGAPVSELLYKPEDTTKIAKRGGTFRGQSGADPANWDYYNFDPVSQGLHPSTAIHFFRFRAGILEPPALVLENELAEKYEYTPDKLTLTIKLNPKAKFAPQSTSGFHAGVPASVFNRVIDADDCVFSFDRLSKTPTAFIGGGGELLNSVNKFSPVLSWTKVDASTFQLKLSRPSSSLLTALGNDQVSYPAIIPKEGRDNAIDFLKTQIGGGLY
jgi:ABC-type transport system substrate-binding protein